MTPWEVQQAVFPSRMAPSNSDVVVLAFGVILAAVYLFRDQLFSASSQKAAPTVTKSAVTNGSGNPRNFIAKMKETVSRAPHLRRPCSSFI